MLAKRATDSKQNHSGSGVNEKYRVTMKEETLLTLN